MGFALETIERRPNSSEEKHKRGTTPTKTGGEKDVEGGASAALG